MREFTKDVKWGDYWYFKPSKKISFSQFEKLNSSSWAKKYNRVIETRIEADEKTIKPTEKQIETFDFILKNQNEIITSIYEYNLKCIYPMFNDAMDIEEDEVVNSISELGRVFGIEYIEIPIIDQDQNKYFLIHFDFRYDDEHGLYILFENSSPIDYFEEGEKHYNAININQNGLENENGEPLDFSLYYVNQKLLMKGNSLFDESFDFSLKKGPYRLDIKLRNKHPFSMYIYVNEDLDKFSLKQLVRMK